jgi:dCTP deaminase
LTCAAGPGTRPHVLLPPSRAPRRLDRSSASPGWRSFGRRGSAGPRRPADLQRRPRWPRCRAAELPSGRAAAGQIRRIAAGGASDTTVPALSRTQEDDVSILSDKKIRELALEQKMIEPFVERQHRDGCISYGLSSYGYDARVSNEFLIFTNVDSAVVDPKQFSDKAFVKRETDVCIIPPNSFALARTVEYFRIPRDVMVICLGKSTYARCGIIVNVTPLEPEWEGHVTLEFSNTTPLPAKVYANEGACQFLFLEGDQPCEVSYRDRKGKYQGQRGVVPPRL